jgi:exopolysaccharide biosynthesis polyprenyl glycosylphosphotransferase
MNPESVHTPDQPFTRGHALREEAAISTPRFKPRSISQRAPRNHRWYVLRRLLAISDVFALVVAAAAAIGLRALVGRPPIGDEELIALAISIPLWPALGGLIGAYHFSGFDHSMAEEFRPVFVTATVWCWAPLLASSALRSEAPEIFLVILLWALAIATILCFRAIVYAVSRTTSWYRQKVVVIGNAADNGQLIARIRRHPETGLDVVGAAELLAADADVGRGEPELSYRGEISSVLDVAESTGAERALVASVPESLDERSRLIRELIECGLNIDVVSGDADVVSSSTVLHYFEGLPILSIPVVRLPRAWAITKRTFDAGAAAAALIVFSPMVAYCAIRIKMESPGPVIFRQTRIGRKGRPFDIVKFRTMFDGADQVKAHFDDQNMHREGGPSMFKIADDPRITKFGAKLRRWSIDELPQLWNVLRGDMSLVGPRPLIPPEAAMISDEYSARFSMRPGITGPWQALGRSDIPFEDMSKLDYTYVRTWNMGEDLRILTRTLGAVAHGRGAY